MHALVSVCGLDTPIRGEHDVFVHLFFIAVRRAHCQNMSLKNKQVRAPLSETTEAHLAMERTAHHDVRGDITPAHGQTPIAELTRGPGGRR